MRSKFLLRMFLVFILMSVCFAPGTFAEEKSITIMWAEWAPADYLMELSKDFTKETGIKVRSDFIPWAHFEQKAFTAFAAKDPAYDVIIGDSQWLGRGATQGHYIELTDWMKKNIDIDAIFKPALTAYGEYPKGSGRYWALPLEADANGFSYRKDLFEDPKEKAAFKEKYGYELDIPKTYDELWDIAEFFTRPEQNLYGVALWLGKAYDAITMGFQQVMWSFGGSYGDPETYQVEGILNSDAGVKALEFYVELSKFTPPGSEHYHWGECLTAFQEGLVAVAMNYFAFYPGLADPATNPFAKVTGYFACPGQMGPDGKFRRYISVGGQGASISAYSRNKEEAFEFLKWFSREEVQVKWAQLGGYTANKKVLESETFMKATPFNKPFSESFPYLRDFWAVPEYADLLEVCQKYWNAAVVDLMSPKAAMDQVAKEHTEIFEEAGYYKK